MDKRAVATAKYYRAVFSLLLLVSSYLIRKINFPNAVVSVTIFTKSFPFRRTVQIRRCEIYILVPNTGIAYRRDENI